MKYDKSKVYTALNADELKVGSKVCVAKNMHGLKHLVLTDQFFKLTGISSEDFQDRFEAEWIDFNSHPHKGSFTLAYLVEEPKSLEWTDLKLGDIIRCKDGHKKRMVIGIDSDNTSLHIYAGTYISDEDLVYWEKVDG